MPAEAGLEGTPARILRAALEQFAERGYHATSIRDIARGAGIQSASLYTHFASKEAILAQLVLIGNDVLHRALLAALVSSGSDPRDQLHSLVRAHVTAHCRYHRLAIVTATEDVHLEEAGSAAAAALNAASVSLASDVIDRGVSQGLFHLVDPVVTRMAIWTMGMSASLWYRNRADQVTPEHAGEVYAQLVLRMVGASGDDVEPAHAPHE